MSMLNKRHAVVVFSEKLISLIVNVIIVSILFKSGSALEVSDFFYVQSLLGIISFLLVLGLPSIIIKEKIEYGYLSNNYIISCFVVAFLGVFIYSVVVFFLNVNIKNININILIVMYFASILKFFDVISYCYIAEKKNHIVSIIIIIAKLVTLFVALILFYNGRKPEELAICFLLEYILISLLNMATRLYIKFDSPVERRADFSILRKSYGIFKECIPLALSSAIASVYFHSDTIMLKNFSSEDHVAAFAVGMKVFLPAITLSVVFSNLIAPYYNKVACPKERLSNLAKMEAYTTAASVSFFIFFYVSSDLISLILFSGDELVSDVMSILAFSWLFVVRGALIMKIVVIEGRSLDVLLRSIFGAIINIVLNLVFIPKYGAKGAAIASVMSFASSDLFFYALRKNTRIYFYSYFLSCKEICFLICSKFSLSKAT
ncbi:polysaccharide biosynthesis C-terminal domain-containing protein [Vibrio campbellii]|uniref:polysaccharide biosynthesis C-terminal domain-containing protein n=1 Tax=Vibrio campbellii TaxID=680 RepID=UPI000154456A|nr:polysaccharide biosynthesis protein [Vibrio campbellii HY01]